MAVEESYCHVSVLVLKSLLELKWMGQLVVLLHTKGKVCLALGINKKMKSFPWYFFKSDDSEVHPHMS